MTPRKNLMPAVKLQIAVRTKLDPGKAVVHSLLSQALPSWLESPSLFVIDGRPCHPAQLFYDLVQEAIPR